MWIEFWNKLFTVFDEALAKIPAQIPDNEEACKKAMSDFESWLLKPEASAPAEASAEAEASAASAAAAPCEQKDGEPEAAPAEKKKNLIREYPCLI